MGIYLRDRRREKGDEFELRCCVSRLDCPFMLTTPMASSYDSSTKTQTEYFCTAVRLRLVPRPDTRTSRFFVFSQILESNRYSIFNFPYLLPPIDTQQVQWCGQSSTGAKGMVANSVRGQLNRETRLRSRNRESQHTSHLRHSRPFRCQCSQSLTTLRIRRVQLT